MRVRKSNTEKSGVSASGSVVGTEGLTRHKHRRYLLVGAVVVVIVTLIIALVLLNPKDDQINIGQYGDMGREITAEDRAVAVLLQDITSNPSGSVAADKVGDLSEKRADELRYVKATLCMDSGDFKCAMVELEQLLDRYPTIPEYLIDASRSAIGLGDFVTAEKHLQFFSDQVTEMEDSPLKQSYERKIGALRQEMSQ